jgi:hypothetical protein
MTGQKILHKLLLITALFVSSLLASALLTSSLLGQPSYGQAPEVQATEVQATEVQATAKAQEPNKWQFQWLKREENQPIVLDNNLRRPFLFFRDAINQRWPLGRLFFIMMLSAGLAKVFAKKMVAGAQERCRKNFLVCLASAFIFTTILLSVSRLAFHTDALVPMALGCIAIVQISYVVGMGLGVNIFANTFSDLIGKRFGQEPQETKKKILGRWFALVTTVFMLTAIAAIPELGRLPRLGNRLVVLVAIIGLGGLISDMRTKSRNRESE